MTDVLVVAELIDGGFRRNTLSAVTVAKQIADGSGGAFDILAIGAGAKAAAATAAKYGARKVFAAEVAGGYFAEKYSPTVAELAKKGYGVVTATASTYGKDSAGGGHERELRHFKNSDALHHLGHTCSVLIDLCKNAMISRFASSLRVDEP